MFNVAVINIKDIFKYLVEFIIIIFIVIFCAKYFSSLKENKDVKAVISDKVEVIKQKAMMSSLNDVLLNIDNESRNLQKDNIDYKNSIMEKILESELGKIDSNEYINKEEQYEEEQVSDNNNIDDINIANNNINLEENEELDNNELNNNEQRENNVIKLNQNNDEQVNENETLEIEKISTEVVTVNPLKETVTDNFQNVKIKNETGFNLTEEMLNPNIEINNKNILIFHTHTCESYTSSEKYSYIPTGSFRTTDLNYTVARVGDELTSYLQGFGFNVNHNKNFHDYPSYNGSYSRSLETVKNILSEYSSDIIIDLHRDAIGSKSDYAPILKIGDEYGAQIMFVIGTNGGGLYHPNWNQNLKFAVKVQSKGEELYPGLFKPIILRNSRYNQHLGKAACIIEVGATGNTLEQCLVSMKYLANVINECIK